MILKAEFPASVWLIPVIPRSQMRFQKLPGMGRGNLNNGFGRADGDDLAAPVPAFGAEVDDPIGGADEV